MTNTSQESQGVLACLGEAMMTREQVEMIRKSCGDELVVKDDGAIRIAAWSDATAYKLCDTALEAMREVERLKEAIKNIELQADLAGEFGAAGLAARVLAEGEK